MTWAATLCVAGSACIIIATLRAEVPTLISNGQYTALEFSEASNGGQDRHPTVPQLWAVADEDVSSPYEYRDRSRSIGRERKLGRSRDERGDDALRSTIRGGAWAQQNSQPSDPEESADDTKNETSSGEDEGGL